ncbi:MAG TPA: SdpI family protein [Blastocatellia bacterium]|nr:SdpI family protein [Blastocatellia bacterium]
MLLFDYLLMTSDMLLILCGATMFWFSPRLRRHWLLGYGSPRSMLNDQTWQAANRFAGLVLSLLALITMSFQVTFWSHIKGDDKAETLAVAAVFVLPFIVMYLTEKYLARLFRN